MTRRKPKTPDEWPFGLRTPGGTLVALAKTLHGALDQRRLYQRLTGVGADWAVIDRRDDHMITKAEGEQILAEERAQGIQCKEPEPKPRDRI